MGDEAPVPDPARKGGLKLVAWAAVGSAMLGAMTMGVPGLLLTQLSEPFIRMIWHLDGSAGLNLRWDWWLVAMYVTVAWPLALVAAYGGAFLAGLRGWAFAAAMAAGTALGAVAITILVYAHFKGWPH